MDAQIITAPNGDRLVVLAETEYHALLEAAENNADREAVREFRDRLSGGDEELMPAEFANRIIDGENKVRVWREYRRMSARDLARAASVSPAYLSEIETSAKPGGIHVMKALAKALRIGLDDLV